MKHPETLQKLFLEQKCALLSGKNTWQTQDYPKQGVPAIWLSDGPNGLRKQAGAADLQHRHHRPQRRHLDGHLPGRRSQTDRLIYCVSHFYKFYLYHNFPERTLRKILLESKKRLASFN